MKIKKLFFVFLSLLIAGSVLFGISFFIKDRNSTKIYASEHTKNSYTAEINLSSCDINIRSISAGSSYIELENSGGKLIKTSIEKDSMLISSDISFSDVFSGNIFSLGYSGIAPALKSMLTGKRPTVNIYISDSDGLVMLSLVTKNCNVHIDGINSTALRIYSHKSKFVITDSLAFESVISADESEVEINVPKSYDDFSIVANESINDIYINGVKIKGSTDSDKKTDYFMNLNAENSKINIKFTN